MSLFKRKKFASRDFTENMLPHNRKEVFFDVMKLHWKSFVLYGLMMMALSLPLFMLSVTETSVLSGIVGDGGNITEEMKVQIFTLKTTIAFFRIPCFLLIALGLSGFIKVIRQYAWEENVHFTTDFFSGVKANAGQMLLLALTDGILYALTTYSFNLSSVSANRFMSLVLLFPVGVFILFIIPMTAYAIAAIPVYKNKFGKLLYLTFALAISSPAKTLLTLVGLLSPLVLQLIPYLPVMLIGKAVFALISPVLLLAWTLFAFTQFDKRINQTQYPELVGRGTYPQE